MKNVLVILFILGIAFSGCSKKDVKKGSTEDNTLSAAGIGEKDKNFKVQYSSPRVVYKIEEVDLDNNGKDEYIVLSIATDSVNKSVHEFYKFDMMEVFIKDSVNSSYKKISTDTVDFSNEYWIMNLEKDKSKQIVIKTDMGGNDVVNSRGMYIFNYDSLKVKLVKYFDTGNPQVKDLNGDGNKEVIVEDSYRGVLPEAGAVYYTSEIYKYAGGRLIKSNVEFKNYYSEQLDNLLNEFEKMKNRIAKGEKVKASEYPLYRQAVQIIMYFISTEDFNSASKFWNNQNEYLKQYLQDDEYEDLKKFVSKLPPIASTI